MGRQSDILKPAEAKAFSEFVAYAATEWAENQSELAAMAGVSPGMISSVISKNKKGGGRTLRGISLATGIPSEEILSGLGLAKLKTKGKSGQERREAEALTKAAQALALICDAEFGDVMAVFAELGSILPKEAPASTFFDVGRAAIERRRAGLPLRRAAP